MLALLARVALGGGALVYDRTETVSCTDEQVRGWLLEAAWFSRLARDHPELDWVAVSQLAAAAALRVEAR